jgi:polyphosphate kinase
VLDVLGDSLLEKLALLLTVLIACIADLSRLFQVGNAKLREVDLAAAGALVLADILWADEILDRVIGQRVQAAHSFAEISLDIDLNVAHEFLQLLVRQVREELLDLCKLDAVVVLLEEAQDVSLAPELAEVLVAAAARVVDLLDRLNLADGVGVVQLADDDLPLPLPVGVQRAEEVLRL